MIRIFENMALFLEKYFSLAFGEQVFKMFALLMIFFFVRNILLCFFNKGDE